MSKFAAIDAAIRLQLIHDNRLTVGYGNWFKATAAPQQGYDYDKPGMLRFLCDVAARLRLDKPPLEFNWRELDLDTCLDAKHLDLVNLIESATADPQLADAKKP